MLGRLLIEVIGRLNAKVKPRDVVVNDLEKDLSDGVSS